jgi:hypothetical protein
MPTFPVAGQFIKLWILLAHTHPLRLVPMRRQAKRVISAAAATYARSDLSLARTPGHVSKPCWHHSMKEDHCAGTQGKMRLLNFLGLTFS